MPLTPPTVPSMAVERLAFHAETVAIMDSDLAAERAALHEAIIDTLRDRDDHGAPRWSHDQILDALAPLVRGQDHPPKPRNPPPHMKGRSVFSTAEAQEIRDTLAILKRARDAGDRPQAKALRDSLRATGFYISDWQRSRDGFQRTDFDQLVYHGLIEIIDR